MNPDECDGSTKEQDKTLTVTMELLHGLEDRTVGHLNKNVKARENREVYAEDALAKKKSYDEMRCEMPGTPRSTFLMVFSPDGSKVASTHGNHNIYVTDLKSGKNIKTLSGHPRTPWCITFHPTSNQILASGCLGGQVRIWDLSGGSEVWTAGNQSVIASIAFHPNDRILVIATYNELYFWDWSKPQPFVQVATGNPKEKVRYVAFDKLGHRLITGIANSPQTRWERVRAPVPVPRQAERSASPYRLRITPRLVNAQASPEQSSTFIQRETPTSPENTSREPVSSVPERERRITASYRNLLREYEQLVQRYLKVYRPPTMIDRGTDPMETNSTNSTTSGTQTSIPSTSSSSSSSSTMLFSNETSQPSTSSQNYSSSLVMPSRILAIKKQPSPSSSSSSTTESRKHKSSECSEDSTQEKRVKVQNNDEQPGASSSNSTQIEAATQTQNPRRVLNFDDHNKVYPIPVPPPPSSSSLISAQDKSPGVRIVCPINKRKIAAHSTSVNRDFARPGTSRDADDVTTTTTTTRRANVDDIISNIRPIADEVRNRFLPIIKSLPACDRPKLIRRFENSTQHERLRLKQMCPNIIKKPVRRPVIDTSSDSSSSDEDELPDLIPQNEHNSNSENNCSIPANNSTTITNNILASLPSTSSSTDIPGVRNFIMELEELLMTILTTEIETSDRQTTNVLNNNSTETSAVVLDDATTARRASAIVDQTTDYRSLTNPLQFDQNEVSSATTTTTTCGIPQFSNSVSTSTRTTTTSTYSRTSLRRRMASHRVSAFMPTRVNYPRPPMRRRGNFRTESRFSVSRGASNVGSNSNNNNNSSSTFALDELINYSERENSEDDPPPPPPPPPPPQQQQQQHYFDFHPFNPPPEVPFINPENIGIGNMYSNIVQDLESSLNNVRNIRASNRPGETSDMLSSFSQSLENIMNQSDTILRNLGGSMEMLPNYPSTSNNNNNNNQTNERNNDSSSSNNEPRISFNDQEFYLRDSSQESVSSSNDRTRPGFNVVESDHNYPRHHHHPVNQTGNSDNVSPLMTSLHLTISYIQRQARLLRQQVESIERIDRAMFEVEQLQLMRQLVMESLRYARTSMAESRSTGMSSVRQMMAGTRITDSSPYDSQSEDQTPASPPSPSATVNGNGPGANNNGGGGGGGGSTVTSTNSVNDQNPTRSPRISGRKTYPPSRLFRLQRQCRRSLWQNFPRRYLARPDRGGKHHTCGSGRSGMMRPTQEALRHNLFSNYSSINASVLNLMARRLEQLLTEQTRLFTRPQETAPPSTSGGGGAHSTATPAFNELGERILSLRLHECVLRINRFFATGVDYFRNFRTGNVFVTEDGAGRYGTRHTLSLIIDCITRHIEEIGNNNVSPSLRSQIHSVLAMSLLLCDLLLLQLVDSIPPPAGMNLDMERESLTSRIDQMCGQMIQNRFSGHSHQLTRSLQHMRMTMRHAYRALGQTYNARRNAIITPNRLDSNRRQLLNRYLRNFNRRRQTIFTHTSTGTDQNTSSGDNQGISREPTAGGGVGGSSNSNNSSIPSTSHQPVSENSAWPGQLRNLIVRYSHYMGGDVLLERRRSPGAENASTNSEDNDDDSEFYVGNNATLRNSNLYRTNNVNLVNNNADSLYTSQVQQQQQQQQQQPESQQPPPQQPQQQQPPPPPEQPQPQSRPWNVPSVQINSVPVHDEAAFLQQRIFRQRHQRFSHYSGFPQMSVLRPRYLHPFYASVNPFEQDLDDAQRDTNYDCDMITTITPNHRIQVWDISTGTIPVINNPLKNIIVSECKIHNDASVDIAKDGTILVTLLPSGGYLNVTNKLGVYSLKWETLGQCLYTTDFDHNAVSVSLSPLSRHLVVGLASRRVTICPTERWIMARIFIINQKDEPGEKLPIVRELEQNRDIRATIYKSVNCIRWLPCSGQGLIYATNTGQLVILT